MHHVAHALGHSHDPGERLDEQLETSSQGIRAVKVSLVLLLVTAALQAVVVALSGSVALFADTIHNVADALTAIPLWIAFRVGRRTATRRFTYGYGRAEDLAGLFVIAVITVSAVFAIVAATSRLFSPRELDHLALVGLAAVVGFVGNEVVARYRMNVGNRIGSAALVADGLHARTDAMTSLAVGASVLGAGLGFPIIDPIVAIVIAAVILKILVDAARHVLRRIMDGVDEDLLTTAETTVMDLPFVSGVDSVRLRWVGHKLWAEIDITIDRDLAFRQAHAIAHKAEHALHHELARLASVTVHAHPPASHGLADTRRPKSGRPNVDECQPSDDESAAVTRPSAG
ncbi:MAG: cation diffusion facilitator family transporter [Acidimicrobiia bacterium]|nr:cation diffusion facilitator family transporter [Acidimicrobiia bacterium]